MDLDEVAAWTGPGPLRTAHQSAAIELEAALAGTGFEVRALEGERIVGPESFFAELFRSVGLEGCEPGWAGFARCRAEAENGVPARLAVLWHRADHSAFLNLKVVAEAAHAFLEWDAERAAGGRQVALFLLGQTRDFPRPGPG